MSDSMNHGLNQFHGLLKIKTFLLIFIRTLESSHETFTMRDRAKVASYLSVALQSDMDYFTRCVAKLFPIPRKFDRIPRIAQPLWRSGRA